MPGEVKFEPVTDVIDFERAPGYSKVKMTDGQKAQLSNLLHYVPQTGAAGTLNKAFIAKFPSGYSKENMMRLKDGGLGGTVVDDKHQAAGHVSFTSASPQAVALGVFTILSAVTSQYFLARIDGQLSLVNEKLDRVLDFLYGENRAELLAEISFVKRVHENYASILMNDKQCQATITNLQAAQKIAIKDLEFYLTDLEAISERKPPDFKTLCRNETEAWKALKCIELALQTLVISSILELYFSENFDPDYMDYTRESLTSYINRCNASVISSFSRFDASFRDYHQRPLENAEARQRYRTMIKETLLPYQSEKDSPLRECLEASLGTIGRENTCYISVSGDVYLKE